MEMVCRGPDRDLLYQNNEFKLQVPEDQVRLPMNEIENIAHFENIDRIEKIDRIGQGENMVNIL